MSDNETTNGRADHSEEVDEPIAGLDGLDQPTSPGFVATLRARIERRQLTGHFASLAWHVPKIVILEFVRLIFDFVGSLSSDEGDSK